MAVKTEFTYPSGDGKTQIRALRWVPDEGISPVGVLQIIHGMQEFIDRYDDFASLMTSPKLRTVLQRNPTEIRS